MATVFKSSTRLSPKQRQAIYRRISEIHAEQDALPLVVASAKQLAREIELDDELTELKRALVTGKLGQPPVKLGD